MFDKFRKFIFANDLDSTEKMLQKKLNIYMYSFI